MLADYISTNSCHCAPMSELSQSGAIQTCGWLHSLMLVGVGFARSHILDVGYVSKGFTMKTTVNRVAGDMPSRPDHHLTYGPGMRLSLVCQFGTRKDCRGERERSV